MALIQNFIPVVGMIAVFAIAMTDPEFIDWLGSPFGLIFLIPLVGVIIAISIVARSNEGPPHE